MKVMIIGANGFLVRKLVRVFEKTEEILAADAVVEGFPFEYPIFRWSIIDREAEVQIISE